MANKQVRVSFSLQPSWSPSFYNCNRNIPERSIVRWTEQLPADAIAKVESPQKIAGQQISLFVDSMKQPGTRQKNKLEKLRKKKKRFSFPYHYLR